VARRLFRFYKILLPKPDFCGRSEVGLGHEEFSSLTNALADEWEPRLMKKIREAGEKNKRAREVGLGHEAFQI